MNRTYTQCNGNVIQTFPYKEDFENNDGSWLAGGSNSDWAWGTPAKPIINKAGSGSKCWISGGLAKNAYNNAENSWLRSPCFDFSLIKQPYISFKIFWETERQYDGGSLQYTVDGGNTWQTLGSYNDPADCFNDHWFNQNGSGSLQNSWSGTVIISSPSNCFLGKGSGNWITAKHTIPNLAGKANVQFRFTFIAGTQCNAFDGIAIDDIYIGETPASAADFTYQCNKNLLVNFSNASSGCQNSFLWNFGDNASGADNNSTMENPSHNFSAPGEYMVSLTINTATGAPSTVTKSITVFNLSANQIHTLKCYGDSNASAAATVSPINSSYTYNWNTVPIQTTDTIINLKAGVYTVTVNADNTCNINDTIFINQPSKLDLKLTISDEKCNNKNGAITTTVSGGTNPYYYNWSNGAFTPDIQQLKKGIYSLKIYDANHCTIDSNNLTITNVKNNISVFIGNDTLFCPGQQLVLDAGNFAKYSWQDNTNTETYTVTQSGKYQVIVTDADGCTAASNTTTITVDCNDIFFPNAFTPNRDGLNDYFGPVGNIGVASNYNFYVYDRWGEIVFQSNDPSIKWDGKFKSYDLPSGTFVWMCRYTFNRQTVKTVKGTVIIIR